MKNWGPSPAAPIRRSSRPAFGAKVVSHGRYVIFHMAEVAVTRDLFADILSHIDRLRPKPSPA